MSILKVINLRKIYRGVVPFHAVKGINFELKKGEILGLLGSNGAGKTTTLQMLLGSLKPTSGQIFYFGQDFVKKKSDVADKIAFAGTYISLPWNLTIAQNLKVVASFYGIDPNIHEERVDFFLDRFDLLSKKDVLVSTLSAGQISRLMLIKAFLVEPRVVLLDEPTAALDADIAKDVLQFLKEQRQMYGTSILYTSHNLREIDEICDRVLFMENGEIVEEGTPQALANMVGNCRLRLINPQPEEIFFNIGEQFGVFFEKVNDQFLCHMPEINVDPFMRALFSQNITLKSFYIDPPSIEGFFLHRTSQKKVK